MHSVGRFAELKRTPKTCSQHPFLSSYAEYISHSGLEGVRGWGRRDGGA